MQLNEQVTTYYYFLCANVSTKHLILHCHINNYGL